MPGQTSEEEGSLLHQWPATVTLRKEVPGQMSEEEGSLLHQCLHCHPEEGGAGPNVRGGRFAAPSVARHCHPEEGGAGPNVRGGRFAAPSVPPLSP